jgi:dipeptidyl aminopeptidase/acylaminoacyl peptidase
MFATPPRAELSDELVVDGSTPSAPVLSPNGRWVTFVVAPVGQADDLPVSAPWIARADGSEPPRQLTGGAVQVSSPQWAPDSQWIFFLSDRPERGTAQLQRIRPAGGDVEALTTWKGGISDHHPLAEPDLIAVIAPDEPTDEEERRAEQRDDAEVWGERVRFSRLRLLDLRTREIRTPEALGDRHVVEVVQRPDGGPLAVLNSPGPRLIWTRACSSPDSTCSLWRAELPGTSALRRWGHRRSSGGAPKQAGIWLTWRRPHPDWSVVPPCSTSPCPRAGKQASTAT